MTTEAEYSYHGTTTPGQWDELKLTGVMEIAERSPIEIINRSKTDLLWYSWNYPDGTPASGEGLAPRDDTTFVVLPQGKMVIAAQHIANQFIFTSEDNPVEYSVHVVW